MTKKICKCGVCIECNERNRSNMNREQELIKEIEEMLVNIDEDLDKPLSSLQKVSIKYWSEIIIKRHKEKTKKEMIEDEIIFLDELLNGWLNSLELISGIDGINIRKIQNKILELNKLKEEK